MCGPERLFFFADVAGAGEDEEGRKEGMKGGGEEVRVEWRSVACGRV